MIGRTVADIPVSLQMNRPLVLQNVFDPMRHPPSDMTVIRLAIDIVTLQA
jgi:hypothetical protein